MVGDAHKVCGWTAGRLKRVWVCGVFCKKVAGKNEGSCAMGWAK